MRDDDNAPMRASTVSVTDLIAKKIVTVKVTDQTNLRKLNPQMAQVIAARFKGATAWDVFAQPPAWRAGFVFTAARQGDPP